jgi:heat-inducible transcriptional repressor
LKVGKPTPGKSRGGRKPPRSGEASKQGKRDEGAVSALRQPLVAGLGERERQILKGIVEGFIRSGTPVGSQLIAPLWDVSAATVRSVMADLEGQGLLEKAHSSSGRRPTDRGYRYYVDTLLTTQDPSSEERERIAREVAHSDAPSSQLSTASHLLHELSMYAGVVATPKPDSMRLRQIDLLKLSGGQILAVLVTPEGLVHNKLLQVKTDLSAQDLAAATASLNRLLQDNSIDDVRRLLRREIDEKRAAYDALLATALSLVERALAQSAPGELLISGQASLLASSDLDLPHLRSLLEAVEEKHRLLEILEQAQSAGSLQIYIGAESDLGEVAGVAVVASPYRSEGRVVGAVGVIGPTRMDYAKVIPLVEYTAHTVSRALSERQKS